MILNELKYEDFINEIKKENRGIDHERGYEIHHIIPKSLGGSNESNNLVKLTYFEHLVAHYLLARDSNEPEMFVAFILMTGKKVLDKKQLNNLSEDTLKEFSIVREQALVSWYENTAKNEEIKQKAADGIRRYWKEHREEGIAIQRTAQLKWINEREGYREQISEFFKNYFATHPEVIEAHKEFMRQWWTIPENRNKLSGENHNMKKPENRQKISNNMKERWDVNNEKYENFRINTLKRLKETVQDPLIRQQISNSLKEYLNLNPEVRERQSLIHKELWKDSEYRENISSKVRGRKTYTNGIKDINLKEDDPIPEGFYLGSCKKGLYFWWNNGEISVLAEKCPEGFQPGMFSQIEVNKEKELKEKAKSANTLIDELKYKVSIPLSNLRKQVRKGKISEEEASLREKDLYNLREEIINKYRSEK